MIRTGTQTSHMDFMVFVVLIHLGFVMSTYVSRREYRYVDKIMNWTDAQRYCRRVHTDLATFESMDDINQLSDRPRGKASHWWIGLHDDPKSWDGTMNGDANSWKWSSTENPTGYQNFDPSSRLTGSEMCVRKEGDGFWRGLACDKKEYFMCYNVTEGRKKYFPIQLPMSWNRAQTYCRSIHRDLALIENEQENRQTTSMQLGQDVWIGLYREPWAWSDGSRSSFKNWKDGQPDSNRQYCTIEDQEHLWEDVPCDMQFPFICHTATKMKKVIIIKMRRQTTVDFSDPTTRDKITQQLKALLVSNISATDIKLTWTALPKREN